MINLSKACFLILTLCGMEFSLIGQANYDENLVPDFLLPELLPSSEQYTPQQWESSNRPQLLTILTDQMFGKVPDQPISIDYHVEMEIPDALDGLARLKEVEMQFTSEQGTLSASLLVLVPKSTRDPVPLFLGMNFCGNHTIHTEGSISLARSWVSDRCSPETDNQATDVSRGKNSSRWPVELILQRGYGLAVIYYGDLDPDFDDGFKNGVHALFPTPNSNEWGSIATWAWGLSRAMDYLDEDPSVDVNAVAVIGHSRLGKAALWAGAMDERFGLVISNNSGCGGAALSKRAYGETIQAINTRFPHWFCDNFNQYNNREQHLPFDQHMLLALIAPRPLYVASALEDQWADPKGEYLSLAHASEVYALYGNSRLDLNEMPAVDQPVHLGKLGYHIRSGKHDVTYYDWQQYLDFADSHWR